jgi:cytochrome c
MRPAGFALIIILAAPSGALLAQGTELLRSKGCLNCHDAERTRVGPSLRDIRARYQGDTSKSADIVSRMKEGKGHPKIAASDAELKAAVEAAISAK